MRIRAPSIVALIGAVSIALVLVVCLADVALARPPEFVETGTDRLLGITVCPDGYAVEGLQIAKGRLLCRAYGLGKADVFDDYPTQRDGMHACPEGTYVRGYSDAHNILICSFDISSGATRFVSGDIRSPVTGHSPPQRAGMHVWSATAAGATLVEHQHAEVFERPVQPTRAVGEPRGARRLKARTALQVDQKRPLAPFRVGQLPRKHVDLRALRRGMIKRYLERMLERHEPRKADLDRRHRRRSYATGSGWRS